MQRQVVFSGKFFPKDALKNPYKLFPFEVPGGAKGVEITYLHDEGNIIDLGLFDPRGCEFLTPTGFRGWSGSARKRVFVSENWATPGYLPGPIYRGIWHVLLGLYKISRHGCGYRVEVHIFTEESPIEEVVDFLDHPASLPQGVPQKPRSGWLKGDLHCHTHHSDAHGNVFDIAVAAGHKGLDFLAITDHNTVSHWDEIFSFNYERPILLPGEEITTYKGHANVWGTGRWLDFRCTSREDMRRVYEVANREERIFSINHPKPGGPPWEFGLEIPFECLEVWHGMWHLGNETSLRKWKDLLQKGQRIIAVGGSDTHPKALSTGKLSEWLGYPTTWIYVKKASPDGILDALKAGLVSISACPHGPLTAIAFEAEGERIEQGGASPCGRGILSVEVFNGKGLKLRLLSSRGVWKVTHVTGELWNVVFPLDLEKEGFIYAELRVPGPWPEGKGPLAGLTNPIWYEGFRDDKIRA